MLFQKLSNGTRRSQLRRAGRAFAVVLLLVLLFALCVYADVERDGHPIYKTADAAPPMPVAIVFGAGIRNAVIDDRVQTGVELYKRGRVRKLLMTGDNGRVGYDEPDAMKAEAVVAGVPARDIACDYAGFRTYDSLYRARDIFGVSQATLVTQGYHLPRALFLARRLGLNVVGVDAARHSYGPAQRWFDVREVAAVEAAWWDARVFHRRPRFLGPREPRAVLPAPEKPVPLPPAFLSLL